MDAVLHSDFSDPRIIQIFQRYATYNGSEPKRTPATFTVIHHAEAAFGSWHPNGGIYRVVESLARLAVELGVDIRTECGVDSLRFADEGKQVSGATLDNGDSVDFDSVVVNADAVAALAGDLFRDHPKAGSWRKRFSRGETSVSGFVLLLAVDRRVEGLSCHNIFFAEDYEREFREIFDGAAPLTDPTLYIHIPSKVDPTLAPEGKESWFVLVNAPPLDRNPEWPDDYAERLLSLIESRLKREGVGFSRDWVLWKRHHTPQFFEDVYGAWKGSLYGLSSNGIKQAFFRVPNRGPVKGLAFAGGSAHPGGGIPLVLQSGRMAAEVLT
jgi:phytoene desaturase